MPHVVCRARVLSVLVLSVLMACTRTPSNASATGAPSFDVTVGATPAVDLAYTRETFIYPQSSKDAFASLLLAGVDVRPHMDDLEVLALMVDRDPRRSVAVLQGLQSTGQTQEQYRLHVGDVLGNFQVRAIRVDGLTVSTRIQGRVTTLVVPFDPSGAP